MSDEADELARRAMQKVNNALAFSAVPRSIVERVAAYQHHMDCAGYSDNHTPTKPSTPFTGEHRYRHIQKVAIVLVEALVTAKATGVDLRLLEHRQPDDWPNEARGASDDY